MKDGPVSMSSLVYLEVLVEEDSGDHVLQHSNDLRCATLYVELGFFRILESECLGSNVGVFSSATVPEDFHWISCCLYMLDFRLNKSISLLEAWEEEWIPGSLGNGCIGCRVYLMVSG